MSNRCGCPGIWHERFLQIFQFHTGVDPAGDMVAYVVHVVLNINLTITQQARMCLYPRKTYEDAYRSG